MMFWWVLDIPNDGKYVLIVRAESINEAAEKILDKMTAFTQDQNHPYRMELATNLLRAQPPRPLPFEGGVGFLKID